MAQTEDRKVLFFRRMGKLLGAHLKVFDYFNHVNAAPGFESQIYLFGPKRNQWRPDNPWLPWRHEALNSWEDSSSKLWFMSGRDWDAFPESKRLDNSIIKFYLVQHIHHADPTHEKFQHLRYKAIRICVSPEIQSLLEKSGAANGPLFTIPNGTDHSLLPKPVTRNSKETDILVVAMKNPEWGWLLEKSLSRLNCRIEVHKTYCVDRADFLEKVSRAKIVVFFPNYTEGFYLPPLEAMAMGCLVVCPDCVGNRSFCLPEHNCLRPEFKLEAIDEAVEQAYNMPESEQDKLISNGFETAAKHDLMVERASFHEILSNVDQIW